MEFKLAKDKKLFWLQNKSWRMVELKPCFPNSNPNKYFAILDEEGVELGLIESLDNLDKQNKSIIENYLSFKCFSFEITGVYKIEEDFGLRHFEVKTSVGDRAFQMQLDEWPVKSSKGEIVFDDLYGEQYFIKNLEFGQKLLRPYI